MSGKHDKAAVPEAKPDLLHTGPIAIRGLGRATRDFFRPDRTNKHRAAADEQPGTAEEALVSSDDAAEANVPEQPAAQDAARAPEPEPEPEPEPSVVPVSAEAISAAFARPADADEDDERVPTAQIPLNWMFSGAEIPVREEDLVLSGPARPESPGRGPVAYPTALAPEEFEHLRRTVAAMADGSTPDDAHEQREAAEDQSRPGERYAQDAASDEPAPQPDSAALADEGEGREQAPLDAASAETSHAGDGSRDDPDRTTASVESEHDLADSPSQRDVGDEQSEDLPEGQRVEQLPAASMDPLAGVSTEEPTAFDDVGQIPADADATGGGQADEEAEDPLGSIAPERQDESVGSDEIDGHHWDGDIAEPDGERGPDESGLADFADRAHEDLPASSAVDVEVPRPQDEEQTRTGDESEPVAEVPSSSPSEQEDESGHESAGAEAPDDDNAKDLGAIRNFEEGPKAPEASDEPASIADDDHWVEESHPGTLDEHVHRGESAPVVDLAPVDELDDAPALDAAHFESEGPDEGATGEPSPADEHVFGDAEGQPDLAAHVSEEDDLVGELLTTSAQQLESEPDSADPAAGADEAHIEQIPETAATEVPPSEDSLEPNEQREAEPSPAWSDEGVDVMEMPSEDEVDEAIDANAGRASEPAPAEADEPEAPAANYAFVSPFDAPLTPGGEAVDEREGSEGFPWPQRAELAYEAVAAALVAADVDAQQQELAEDHERSDAGEGVDYVAAPLSSEEAEPEAVISTGGAPGEETSVDEGPESDNLPMHQSEGELGEPRELASAAEGGEQDEVVGSSEPADLDADAADSPGDPGVALDGSDGVATPPQDEEESSEEMLPVPEQEPTASTDEKVDTSELGSEVQVDGGATPTIAPAVAASEFARNPEEHASSDAQEGRNEQPFSEAPVPFGDLSDESAAAAPDPVEPPSEMLAEDEALAERGADLPVVSGERARSTEPEPTPSPEHAVAPTAASPAIAIAAEPFENEVATAGPSPRMKASSSPRGPRAPRSRLAGGRITGGGGGVRPWGYVALAVLAVLCIALVAAVIVKTRNDAAIAAKEAAAYTPPPPSTPSASPSAALPVVSVVGDQYTTGTKADSGAKSEWPALLATALNAQVKTYAAAGAGFVTKGSGGATLVTEASKVDPASTVVVLFGGTNDQPVSSLTVASAATNAIKAAHTRAPKAKIVVVGPASGQATPPQSLTAIRDTLRVAANVQKAKWVDPISGGWLSSSASLTDGSGNPTNQGEKVLETQLRSALKGIV